MLTVSNPETFNWAEISLTDCVEGNALDTTCTLDLYYIFKEIIENNGDSDLFNKLVSKGQEKFVKMEYKGVDVDIETVDAIDAELKDLLEVLSANLYEFEEVAEDVNIGSDKQLAEILFTNDNGFCMYPPVRTDKGEPSVNKEARVLLLSQIKIELEKRNGS